MVRRQVPVNIPALLIGVFVILSAGSLFAYISLTNHYYLRTYALDLGMFNHAIYQVTQFEIPQFTLGIDGKVIPYLADHFSPVIFLFAPVYAIVGATTLLWIQVLSIIVFAWYTRKMAILVGINDYIASLLLLIPLSCWALFAAIGFDFHTNVLAAMMVMPMFYFIYTKKYIAFWTTLIFILLCKENMSLWMVFVLTGMILFAKKQLDVKSKKILWLASGISLIYFISVTTWVMPSLHPEGVNVQMNKYVGSDQGLVGILSYCIQHPLTALELIYCTPEGNISSDKVNFLILFATSGGLLWLINPMLLWMSIPILAQKILSTNGGFWGIDAQYSIEFVPLIAIGLIFFLKDYAPYLSLTFIAISTYICATINYADYLEDHPNSKFYDPAFSQTELELGSIKSLLEQIPDSVPVSSVSNLSTRLEKRSRLYQFPFVHDAQFLILFKGPVCPYPLNAKQYMNEINALSLDTNWVKWNESKEVVIYNRLN